MKKQLSQKELERIGGRAGLSLLEVIIATVVLSFSAMMLVKIIGTADRNASRADERLRGQLICQNKMEELQAGMLALESADLQSTAYYPDWQYTIKVEEWNNEAAALDGRLVIVEIDAYYRPEENELETNLPGETGEQRPAYTLRRLIRKSRPESFEPENARSGEWE